MQSVADRGLDLKVQLACKEREWKELQAVRVHQLESSLKMAQEECCSLREHYTQLREDFQFNLAILDERDRELEKYDVITSRALTVEHNRQGEVNQLRKQIKELEEQRAKEAAEMQKELNESLHDASQHRLQLDKFQRSMADQIQKLTAEYEKMKWNFKSRIQEVEGEMASEREEMTAAFDRELAQHEHEFKLKMDKMHAVVLSHDLKVKLLSKETEVHYQAQLQATVALKASAHSCQQMQAQLLHKDQELNNLTAVKDHRIKELQDELGQMETKLKNTEDDNMKQYESVAQALKGCDMQLEVQKQALIEQLGNAEKRLTKLRENLKILSAKVCCMQRDQQKAMGQKDRTIHRLCAEVGTTRTGWDEYISQVSTEIVNKDQEMLVLQDRESKLRTELERSREEILRYKQQLCAGLKREKALEQMKVQVELECQRQCENMKASLYLANEKLIEELTKARDQAKAELKEKEQNLQDLTFLLHSVRTERDQAIKGIAPKVDSLASEEICRLQEQNGILRAVVAQMRKEMERLSRSLLLSQAQPRASSPKTAHSLGSPAATSISPIAGTQMVTAPHPQSTDISPIVSQAGDQFVENCAKTTCRKNQEDTVAPVVSALTKIVEKIALMQQLQEENVSSRQQQASVVFENVQATKSDPPPVLRKRLKQAASCIARLSGEKQQLIELGNRLRAQISASELQEPVKPEKDLSTKKQGEQYHRLSDLEQLQYQLTSKELQYALGQTVCTDAEQLLHGTNNRGPTTKQTATDRSESYMNKENMFPLSQSQSSLDGQPQPLTGLARPQLSSEDSLQSLKELWETLDHVISPSVFSEGNADLSRGEVAKPGGAEVRMMVHGVSASIHSHIQAEVQQRMNPCKTPSDTPKTRRPGAGGQIRNYNLKE